LHFPHRVLHGTLLQVVLVLLLLLLKYLFLAGIGGILSILLLGVLLASVK